LGAAQNLLFAMYDLRENSHFPPLSERFDEASAVAVALTALI
jgi:hypothetical protein